MSRKVIEDHAAGMGPHRPGFPERLSEVRVERLDQLAGMVERSPSELRSSEVRVERLDQEAGRLPPREGDLQGAIRWRKVRWGTVTCEVHTSLGRDELVRCETVKLSHGAPHERS